MSKNDNLQNVQTYIHEDSLISQLLNPTLAGYDGREYFEHSTNSLQYSTIKTSIFKTWI